MALQLNWKVGFEVELMAPKGVSRRDLADRLADRIGGRVVRVFHPDSEPAKVPGTPVFENLTPGFRVEDADGNWAASFVDDLTLQADFNRSAPPQPGWYRIVSDDARFIRLVEQQCDAEAPIETVLDPIAKLFGTEAEAHPSGMIRVHDDRNVSLAMAAPLPGERERPCELVTAPITANHQAVLADLLGDAIALGFSIPKESATHIHFDAKPLRSPKFIARFVQTVTRFGDDLRRLVKVNSACARLGQWPPELAKAVTEPGFIDMSWDEVRAAFTSIKLTKYCDFNLVNMLSQTAAKDTIEVRILPGMIDAQEIIHHAALFEAILRWCRDSDNALPNTFVRLIQSLPLDPDQKEHWLKSI